MVTQGNMLGVARAEVAQARRSCGGADDAEHVAPDGGVEGYGFEGGEMREG